MNRGKARLAFTGRFAMVGPAQQSDEDQAMRIVCYSLCAILVGLLLYTMLP
ncbi:MAG: hypothetical protein WCA20_24060 [Candidatus Sulfotelmatobacter sp.]